jgi:hypothetical protein
MLSYSGESSAVGAQFGMIEVQWVGALAGVESLPDEIGLRIFEGAG